MDTPNLDSFLKQHNDNTKGLGREIEKMNVVTLLRKMAADCPSKDGSLWLTTAADAITCNVHRTVRA